MSTVLRQLYALNHRLDIALATLRKDEIAFGPLDENYDTTPGIQPEHIGALAGAAGGLAAGAALPSIARSQAGIDQAARNAKAQRIRTARTQDRVAAANGISNERVAGARLRTAPRPIRPGMAGMLDHAANGAQKMGTKVGRMNRGLNKRLAGGGGRGIAAGVLGIGGALGGYAAGKLLNPASY